MKIAIGQISCIAGDIEYNCRKIQSFTQQAKDAGCELVVFPELADTGYQKESIIKHAGEWPGPAFDAVQQTAAQSKITLICGLSERQRSGIYNTLAVFGPDGTVLSKYRKINLFVIAPAREDSFLSPGDSVVTVPIGDFTFGLMICFDIRFPELARELVTKGADSLICSAAWPRIRRSHWEILTAARALENRCYLIACNRSGTDKPLTFAGGSALIGPDGKALTEDAQDSETLIISDMAINDVLSARRRIPTLPR